MVTLRRNGPVLRLGPAIHPEFGNVTVDAISVHNRVRRAHIILPSGEKRTALAYLLRNVP